MLLLFTVITIFSCSNNDDGDNQAGLPDQGNISLALSNGGGFVVENLVAFITNLYDTSNTTSVTITGLAGASGSIVIRIIDNDSSFRALVNENSIAIGDATQSFYATVDYQSDTFNLDGQAGTLEVIQSLMNKIMQS